MKYQAYPDKGNWYKGNIHSHTTLSDGSVEPMDQIRLYESHGYDFLAFTDHNVMNSRPEWNTGRMLMIPGWERDISYEYKIKCTHLVGLFPPDIPAEASKRLPAGDKDLMTDQMLIDEMRKDNVFISVPTGNSLEKLDSVMLEEIPAQPLLCPEIGGYFIKEMERVIREKNLRITLVKNPMNLTSHLIRSTNFLTTISTLSRELRNDGPDRKLIPLRNPEFSIRYDLVFQKENIRKATIIKSLMDQ